MNQEEFYFTIYRPPAQLKMKVRGRERFAREQAFLDQFLGRIPTYQNDKLVPNVNFYMLNDDQFDKYMTFRRQMDAEFGKPE